MMTYLYRRSNLKSTITFLASVSWWKSVSGNQKELVVIIWDFCNSLNDRSGSHFA